MPWQSSLFRIVLRKSVKHQLEQIRERNRNEYNLIGRRINDLAREPFPSEAKRVHEKHNFLTVRVGIFRIVYTVNKDAQSIELCAINNSADDFQKLIQKQWSERLPEIVALSKEADIPMRPGTKREN